MKYTSLFFLSLALFACQEPKKAKQKKEIDPKILITCNAIGEIGLKDTHQSLVDRFGKNAITEHENTVYGHYSTVFEGDEKQVNVYWKESSAPFKTVKFVEVNTAGSVYMTKDSVKVGLTMRQLVKLNGFMPVTFKNIWQPSEAGIIKSFNGGTVESNSPCLSGFMEQVKINVVHKDEIKAFRNKEWVESSDPLFNRIDMELSSIRIFPKQ
ncbi:hypothetical protein [Desertivirga xinjiangensis]|uniref:hypothetical protein n=1 Tax=Desertivirga xinjiangensis TaxID=539206 RepID=UPI00210BBDEE|nr:hypothetical protein [Pedobacter xinjiangensis]